MRRVVVVLAAALMLSACTEQAKEAKEEGPPPKLTSTDVSSLRVTGQQAQPSAPSAWLSPDGRTVIYNSGDKGACVRGVDGSNEHCFDRRVAEFDASTAAWSPDGSELAITETHAFGLEPDIWLLDVSSGELTNLTDDGLEQELSLIENDDMPDGAAVDVFPSWDPDGNGIRFLRMKSDNTMAVAEVPADGGEVTELRMINAKWSDLRAVAWTDDRVAWTSGTVSVWVADLRDGDQRTVLDGVYSVLSFSSDGNFLLADERDEEGNPAVGKACVVPVRGGDPVLVAAGGVTVPTWAPEGHALAYVEAPGIVRVVGKPGDAPRDLHTGVLGAADLESLDWAKGALLVMAAEDTPVLLSVAG